MVSADESDLETIRFQAALLDSVGQAVIATDIGGIVIYWNSAAERLYGWTAQEATGRANDARGESGEGREATLRGKRQTGGDSWAAERHAVSAVTRSSARGR